VTSLAVPRWFRHRAFVVTAVLLIAWGVFLAWSHWSGSQKLPPSELAGARDGRVNVQVTLDFAPEAFHMAMLQSVGRLIEVRGATAYLMDVPVADARSLARRYWVKDIRSWQGR
jgi:hypothetical protein